MYLIFYVEECDRVEWISMRPNYMINGARLCLNKNESSFLILLNKYWCSGMPQIGYTQRFGRLEGAARARAARHYFQRGCARAEIWVTSSESANTIPASRTFPPRISFYVRLTSEGVFNTYPTELLRTSRKTIRKSTERNHIIVANPEAWILHTSQVHCTESDTGGQVVGWWGSGVSRPGCAGSPHERALHTAERHALRAPALTVSPRARQTIFGAKNPGFQSDTVIATDLPSHSRARFILLLLVASDNRYTLRTLDALIPVT